MYKWLNSTFIPAFDPSIDFLVEMDNQLKLELERITKVKINFDKVWFCVFPHEEEVIKVTDQDGINNSFIQGNIRIGNALFPMKLSWHCASNDFILPKNYIKNEKIIFNWRDFGENFNYVNLLGKKMIEIGRENGINPNFSVYSISKEIGLEFRLIIMIEQINNYNFHKNTLNLEKIRNSWNNEIEDKGLLHDLYIESISDKCITVYVDLGSAIENVALIFDKIFDEFEKNGLNILSCELENL